MFLYVVLSFFFFNDTATTEIYTLSLHDALPISRITKPVEELAEGAREVASGRWDTRIDIHGGDEIGQLECQRSEEHTSELQSQSNLVCRLLLEKKNT